MAVRPRSVGEVGEDDSDTGGEGLEAGAPPEVRGATVVPPRSGSAQIASSEWVEVRL